MYTSFGLNDIGESANARVGNSLPGLYINCNYTIPRCSACTARELWQHLWQVVEEENTFPEEVRAVMEVVLKEGNLAERISRALGPEPGAGAITQVYRQLATCLAGGTMFLPG